MSEILFVQTFLELLICHFRPLVGSSLQSCGYFLILAESKVNKILVAYHLTILSRFQSNTKLSRAHLRGGCHKPFINIHQLYINK